MSSRTKKSNYTFYVEEWKIDKINDIDGYSQSKAAREALSQWLESRDNGS